MFSKILIHVFLMLSTCSHSCDHAKRPQREPIFEKPHPERNLETTATWRPMNVLFDYAHLKTNYPLDAGSLLVQQVILPGAMALLRSVLMVSGRSSINAFPGYACGPEVTIPGFYTGISVPADLLVIVNAVNDTSTQTKVTGGPCMLSSTDFRPIVGFLIFNIANLEVAENGLDMIARHTLHEIQHILAFTPFLYGYFPTVRLGIMKMAQTDNGIEVQAPGVIAWARAYFNCPNLTGVPMEYTNQTGYGAHWDKSLLGEEFMTNYFGSSMIMSDLTYWFLADSGWYRRTGLAGEVLTWGMGKGCGFLNLTCPTGFSEYCDTTDAIGCTSDYKSVSVCKSNSATHGCKHYVKYKVGSCSPKQSNLYAISDKVEKKGKDSRCFLTEVGENKTAGCFPSACDAFNRVTFIAAGTNYTCPLIGGNITIINVSPIMTISCPNATDFCGHFKVNRCLFDCNGFGTCQYGGACSCQYPQVGLFCKRYAGMCPIPNIELCSKFFPFNPLDPPIVPTISGLNVTLDTFPTSDDIVAGSPS